MRDPILKKRKQQPHTTSAKISALHRTTRESSAPMPWALLRECLVPHKVYQDRNMNKKTIRRSKPGKARKLRDVTNVRNV